MPELPEVETTLRGIRPSLLNQQIQKLIVRNRSLRWPVPDGLEAILAGKAVNSLKRRGKYILIGTDAGTAILHLGMSGSLRILDRKTPAAKHDHVDFVLHSGKIIRFNDPRRFGSLLWSDQDPSQHKLLAALGPEPLSNDFDGEYLYTIGKQRKVSIKQLIMNSHIVVGVGNIYASESLFRAGIRPTQQAKRLSKKRYLKLVKEIKTVLAEAIEMGGTTLRDFQGSDGKPGYFSIKLKVYGRAEEACDNCGSKIKHIVQGQRATYYCRSCQS
ncbi:MAG: bifunctional DNA-formamidopyrimidine glycosylase/DNA-(apurinic or apyrimidinic site) lyase [Gammaproteobacteria bacterium]|jgi:formamidopyrimidine-DNA glycosylase|nr:bifunctional DNA-formamidopyrimidine glycosylase/DNA-(apurinic or apyrimidinic site) lyase [Gammaproteobacteria bacterium]